MDEIDAKSLHACLNRVVKIEREKKIYVGRLIHVDDTQIKLRLATKQRKNQTVSILIEEIDAVMYRIAEKRVGY
ncbi:hypothetical protein BEP19_08305 [Ammoniphilus oxalaticus]|uniref:Uncharacterized protein n=1 Tax=Ammoniphilus oxalaticus TaxID=66863 RepID=A0A419SKC5_9BACL|nr:hypothetical protein [Ammoniphilus oxalaticus]RKD24386.1 hypothetical protein BEP19_08305 [Ammoniphilus oxalaticus]